MKKRFEVVSLVIVVFLIGLVLFPNISAEDDEDQVIARKIRNNLEKTAETLQAEDPVLSEDEAPGRDADVFWDYLSDHCGSDIWHHFAGLYLDENRHLVILLSCEEDGDKTDCTCRDVLCEIGFETEIVIKGCRGSYYNVMENLREIGRKTAEMNERVRAGKGTEEENELDSHFPSSMHMAYTNSILVRVAAESPEEFEKTVSLFKKLIGDYPDVEFETATEEELNLKDYFYPVRPGCGIQISNAGVYSLGFRARYLEDNVYHYGMVTAAHGNAIGQTVYLFPYSSSTPTLVGSVAIRNYSSSADAAFIEFTGNYQGTQQIYYTDSSGGNTVGPVLDGNYASVAVNMTIQKSGRRTYLSSGMVSSASVTAYVDGVCFSDMFSVYGQIADVGDSGAITYKILNGTTVRTVGIVKAGNESMTLFFKAPAVFLSLGVLMY